MITPRKRVLASLLLPTESKKNCEHQVIMKAERFVLSFIAILIGVLVAGGAFYAYQVFKKAPSPKPQTISIKSPTPTPRKDHVFTVDNPTDESVVNKRSVTVSGKTEKDATIIVSVPSNDQVIKPSANGDYSVTMTIDDGANVLGVTSIFPDGQEEKIERTITYSTENF